MTAKNAAKFIEELDQDDKLMKKVLAYLSKNNGKEIEALAKKLNFDCTYKEFIKAFYQEKQKELNESEMEKIRAAGVSIGGKEFPLEKTWKKKGKSVSVEDENG